MLEAYLKLLLVSSVILPTVSAFSSGASIAQGTALIRSLYCGREPLHRAPFHLNTTRCGGYCHASLETSDKYEIQVSDRVYWDTVINVTISTLPGSSYKLTGFAVSAINGQGTVVGRFEETANVTVAVCNKGTKVEGSTAFHTNADHGRTSVTLQWTGPRQNYNDIKFRVWIVHSHDVIFYLESPAIRSLHDGSGTADLQAILRKLLGSKAALSGNAMERFESSFQDRQDLGFLMDTGDPFQHLRRLPRPEELIPAHPPTVGSDPASGPVAVVSVELLP